MESKVTLPFASSIRTSQLLEQKKRNINHTRAIDVLKIGKVLGCKSEDLLEI